MNTTLPFESLPAWGWVVIGVLAVAQLTVEIWALVDMLKRPADQLTLGGRKWLWAILILAVNWVGAILYFAAGRRPASVADVASAVPTAVRADAAMDALYGVSKDRDE